MVYIILQVGCGAMRPRVMVLVWCGGSEGKDCTVRFAAESMSSFLCGLVLFRLLWIGRDFSYPRGMRQWR
jgi:hypothetical protein